MLNDIRGALRRLRQAPGAALAAILALGLGIGFSSSTYSVADALLYRPLPLPELGRVVAIGGREPSSRFLQMGLSAVDYNAWKNEAHSFQSVGLARGWEAALTGAGDPVNVSGASVSASFFDVMALKPAAGRTFLAEEETPGRDQSVILSDNLWRRQFGSDAGILGREISLSGRKYTVVGIMPAGFTYPQPAEFWTPLALEPAALANDTNFYLRSVARLKPGVSPESASAEVAALGARLAQRYPQSHGRVSMQADELRKVISGQLTAEYMSLTIGASLFVLLIACVNVASLQFSRVLGRSREMAIRGALGASRWRLLRQSLSESLLLAVLGAAAGLTLSAWCLDLLRASMPPEVERWLPAWQRIGLNGWVLFWTTLTTIAAGLVSGIGPAIWLSRAPALAGSLHEQGRGSTSGRGRQRLRLLLVSAQTALALVMLIAAGLIARTFQSVARVQVSADPRQVLTARIVLPQARYPERGQVVRFQRELLERLGEDPAVARAALTTDLPYSSAGSNRSYVTFERRPAEPGAKLITQVENISEGYFDTLGIDIRQGRGFSGSESETTQLVAVVNQAFARQFFPQGNALGHRFELGDGRYYTITGICADVLHNYVQREAYPTAFLSFRQGGWNGFDLAIRTRGDSTLAIPALRQALRQTDPLQPASLVVPYSKMISDNTLGIGYVASMISVMAGVALFLALIGLYSQIAWSVGERTREIGVRLALGATRSGILLMVLRQGATILALGLLLGAPLSWFGARALAGVLFGVSSSDALTFTAIPAALILAATAACLLPARRATRTDPLTALRHE